jgi:hypothetical protein
MTQHSAVDALDIATSVQHDLTQRDHCHRFTRRTAGCAMLVQLTFIAAIGCGVSSHPGGAVDAGAMVVAGSSVVNAGASGHPTAGASSPGTPLPSCQWPTSLDDPNAARGACRPARTLLSCDSGGGATVVCLSDDPTSCANAPTASACSDTCAVGEYAVSCGTVGPSSGDFSPPSGCHTGLATPARVVFYCCPCG